MTQVDTGTEYAIEVPGRGYMGFAMSSVQDEPDQLIQSESDAIESLKHARRRFVSLGCPDISETLRVVQRTITVTRDDWRLIDD